jgi:hypothetical protein
MIVSSAVTAALVTGAIGAGTATASGIVQSKANKKARKEQTSAIDKQIAFEEKRDVQRRKDYEREQEERKRQWDAEQQWIREQDAWNRHKWESEMGFQRQKYDNSWNAGAPYREGGLQGLSQLQALAAQAGVTLQPVQQAPYEQLVAQERSIGALGRRTA